MNGNYEIKDRGEPGQKLVEALADVVLREAGGNLTQALEDVRPMAAQSPYWVKVLKALQTRQEFAA